MLNLIIKNIINIITIFLFGIIFILFFINKNNKYLLKSIALKGSLLIFFLSLFIWLFFDKNTINYQFVFFFNWFSLFNIKYIVGVDGISIFFIILTTFLIPICILSTWNSVKERIKEYLILLFFIEFFVIQVFCILDLFLFYIFFEAILIPMFILIGVWGSRIERIEAALKFFFYTLIGSLFMLLGIFLIYRIAGSTNYYIILNTEYTILQQKIIWLFFFLGFSIKIPMLPFHIWLPQAHVEAPTAGSILLAGILLKLGGYGLIRFNLNMFPEASQYFTPLIYTISVLGIFYASLTTIRQIDLKRIIAYSSVAHMNYVVLGIFSNTIIGIEGSIFLMISHGIVSSALFIFIGLLYERYNTRSILDFSGLTQIMPLGSFFFFFFTISNMSFPGTSGFIGELLVLLGCFKENKIIGILASFFTVFGSIYSIWLFVRVFFGSFNLNSKKKNINFRDITEREFIILVILLFLVIILGFFPNIILNEIEYTICSLI